MFDQATSATARVNVHGAADRGEAIPEGWAQDPSGAATVDAEAALAGSLLPFGGVKGSIAALMIELLAVHGEGRFSVDFGRKRSLEAIQLPRDLHSALLSRARAADRSSYRRPRAA